MNVLAYYCLLLQYVLQKMYILRPDKRKLVILNKMSGVLRPGRTTLLLGPPASGKSTLLKALADTLQHSGLKVTRHSLPLISAIGDFASGCVIDEEASCGLPALKVWLGSPSC